MLTMAPGSCPSVQRPPGHTFTIDAQSPQALLIAIVAQRVQEHLRCSECRAPGNMPGSWNRYQSGLVFGPRNDRGARCTGNASCVTQSTTDHSPWSGIAAIYRIASASSSRTQQYIAARRRGHHFGSTPPATPLLSSNQP